MAESQRKDEIYEITQIFYDGDFTVDYRASRNGYTMDGLKNDYDYKEQFFKNDGQKYRYSLRAVPREIYEKAMSDVKTDVIATIPPDKREKEQNKACKLFIDVLLSKGNILENQLNAAEAKVSELEDRVAKLEAENKTLINNSDEVRAGQGVFKVLCTFKDGETITDFLDEQPSIESADKTMQLRQEFIKKRDGIEFEYAIEKSSPAEMYKARYEGTYAENYRLKARCAELESKTQPAKAAKTNTHDKPRPIRENLEKAIQEAKSNSGKNQQQNKAARSQGNYEMGW